MIANCYRRSTVNSPITARWFMTAGYLLLLTLEQAPQQTQGKGKKIISMPATHRQQVSTRSAQLVVLDASTMAIHFQIGKRKLKLKAANHPAPDNPSERQKHTTPLQAAGRHPNTIMLSILRFLSLLILGSVICLFGLLFCLFRPRDPQHVARLGHLLGSLAPLCGLRLICRFPGHVERFGQAVYIGNHQNNYDMFTISSMVPPSTVTIGKQSLIWIPLFGPLYWLSGNILLNRTKQTKAYSTMAQVVSQLQTTQRSVWMFPEGTRSRGRGLMPFKTGAFHTAIAAGVPIIPICASNLHRKVHWNRWRNGWVIIEMLAPISTEGYGKHQARELAEHCYHLMQAKIAQLDAEVALRESAEALKPT